MNDSTCIVPDTSVKASVHDDGVVLFHVARGRIFSSNRIGAAVWRGIERQLPLETIVRDVATQYQVALETVRADAARFVAELERQQLVTPSVRS